MAESGFSPVGASQFTFMPIDPNNPMNDVYARQVEDHARRNPYDAYAQAHLLHWINGMQQIRLQQAQRAAVAAAVQGPTGFPMGAGGAPAPVPSTLLFSSGPSPPQPASGATSEVRAQGFYHHYPVNL